MVVNKKMEKQLQEIETKIRAILSIKKIRKGLTPEEEHSFNILEKKYRDKKGHLLKGSFFINSNNEWEVV
jgi:hypothetical protein